MTHTDNAEVIQQWSTIPRAEIEAFGDRGDFARQFLLTPTILTLLGDITGQHILDAGCGQGYLSRLLAQQGARVVGLEPALPLIQYAREREQLTPLGISYLQADLATFVQTGLEFDTAIANMVLMDIPDDQAALASCVRHLRYNGQFIFSISHPCFEESDTEYAANGYLAVREYFAEYHIPQRFGYRIHRPLQHYFALVLQHGMQIGAVIEPQLSPADRDRVPENARMRHIPSFLVIQAVKLASSTYGTV